MGRGRFEAFSDGVIAIIITIMVLELKVPRGADFDALQPLLPTFLSYVLSFVNIGIYWNNHHHLVHTVKRVNASILWSNLHLLFWLSLLPFATAWMGENHLGVLPVTLYGVVLLMAGVAYFILQTAIVRSQGQESLLARAIGADWKGKASPLIYVAGVIVAFWSPALALAAYVAVALMWLIPDKRIEKAMAELER
jgi:uncharacterized membrane protein